MNEKELKRLLYGYTYIKEDIEQCRQEILKLAEAIETERGPKGMVLSDMPRSGLIQDETYQKVQRIYDVFNKQVSETEGKIQGLYDKKNYIEFLLTYLTDIERKIIEFKYFKKYQWWMIEGQMHYSRRQCFRYHDEAIKKLLNMSPNGTFYSVL